MGQWECKVSGVLKAIQAPLGRKVRQVLKARPGLQDRKVLKVILARQELRAQPDLKGQPVRPVRQDLKA